MTVTAAAALWPGLRKILLRVGRPLIRWLSRKGVALAIRACRSMLKRLKKRSRRVRARFDRATSPRALGRHERRLGWLSMRRANWAAARLWLAQRREQLGKAVARELESRLDDAIPESPPCEDYARWCAAEAP